MAENSNWGPTPFTLTKPDGTTSTISVSGRYKWALQALIAAGTRGCTPIDDPAPRWSAYAHYLRNIGVPIETITEPHGGPFKGTHARYVLMATVTRAEGLKP